MDSLLQTFRSIPFPHWVILFCCCNFHMLFPLPGIIPSTLQVFTLRPSPLWCFPVFLSWVSWELLPLASHTTCHLYSTHHRYHVCLCTYSPCLTHLCVLSKNCKHWVNIYWRDMQGAVLNFTGDTVRKKAGSLLLRNYRAYQNSLILDKWIAVHFNHFHNHHRIHVNLAVNCTQKLGDVCAP